MFSSQNVTGQAEPRFGGDSLHPIVRKMFRLPRGYIHEK
jgi:hypothetical protein